MDTINLICPQCRQIVKTFKGKVQDHKVTVILSGGRAVKVQCPGVGKKAV